MKHIDDIELSNKRVFIRADLNVPFAQDGSIADDTRLKAAADTVRFAIEQNARVIVSSHLGRPKGERIASLSLKPVASALSALLDSEVGFVEDCIGVEVEQAVEELAPGQVLLLENLRFHGEEKKADKLFAEKLARLADVYINDAFATAHRAHASTAILPGLVAERAAGLTLKRELLSLKKALKEPARPLVAIIGGAKISSKIAAITHIAELADEVLVGGAMANTFFAAQGHPVGTSLFEESQVETAQEILRKFNNIKLPVDLVVAESLSNEAAPTTSTADKIPADKMALDIGPESLKYFSDSIASAGTVVWNGPMGAFEFSPFSAGTFGMARALADSKAFTVVGGGDSDLAVHQSGVVDSIDYMSTGGGAFLCVLEGAELPAVRALG